MMMVPPPLWWISQRGPPAIRGNRRRLIDTDPSAEQQLILYRSEREHLLIPHNPFITRARATRTGAGHQHDLYPIRREDKCGAGTSSAPTTAPLFHRQYFSSRAFSIPYVVIQEDILVSLHLLQSMLQILAFKIIHKSANTANIRCSRKDACTTINNISMYHIFFPDNTFIISTVSLE